MADAVLGQQAAVSIVFKQSRRTTDIELSLKNRRLVERCRSADGFKSRIGLRYLPNHAETQVLLILYYCGRIGYRPRDLPTDKTENTGENGESDDCRDDPQRVLRSGHERSPPMRKRSGPDCK